MIYNNFSKYLFNIHIIKKIDWNLISCFRTLEINTLFVTNLRFDNLTLVV